MQQPDRAPAYWATLATLAILITMPVFAAPLAPGGAMLVPGESDPTGGTIVGNLISPFESAPGPAHFSGTLATTVIRDDPSNPFANVGNPNPYLHGLTFVYELHNDASSLSSIARMTNVDYSLFITNVSYQTPTAGRVPTSVDRSSLFLTGAVIGWNFTTAPLGLGQIMAGENSAKLVVQTDAPQFVDIRNSLIDGQAVQAATYGPEINAPAPEPGTGLLIAATAALVIRRRKIVA